MTFFKRSVEVVHLSRWLDWAGGKGNEMYIALPMIQRGSVWKPYQIIDLWDSLLQGMPIGCMLVSELKAGTSVRRPGKHERERVPLGGGWGLIDGQQRTLAMLIAWRGIEKMDRRVWVDFADEPAAGQLLRLRVTSENQPFGFQRNDPSRKLSLDDRRKARSAFSKLGGKEVKPNLDNAWPFSHHPGLPIDLGHLIDLWRDEKRDGKRDLWLSTVQEELRSLQGAKFSGNWDTGKWNKVTVWDDLNENKKSEVIKRVEELADALERLDNMEMPLVRVHERFFETRLTVSGDPPLAILFKRIGTNGTELSPADYVYSVIKHLQPETYDLVEMLHSKRNVACLMTATDLVMSAVRLAAVTWKPDDGRTVPDMESPSMQEFQRLLHRGDFIHERFLPLIQKPERGGVIDRYFDEVQATLQYRGGDDTGLPRQAFPLLGRPLIQVLLRLAQVGYLNNGRDLARREDVLRLALFWLVAVTNKYKSKASHLAYEVIKEKCDPDTALGRAIHDRLVEKGAAYRLPSPEDIEAIPGLALSPAGTNLLRGDARFDCRMRGEEDSRVSTFYRNHWWRPRTPQHPILLWMQRKLVAEEFDQVDPMAGRDEDTPYDYDHILPCAHWEDWRGATGGDGLLKFAEDQQIWVVGNAIGNVRVWESSLNRSDCDQSPTSKLKLDGDVDERSKLLKDSAIDVAEAKYWQAASGPGGKPRSWGSERAVAFQCAVEKRTFYLYRRYFNELGFAEWPKELSPNLGDERGQAAAA
jgi:hypothetical protein